MVYPKGPRGEPPGLGPSHATGQTRNLLGPRVSCFLGPQQTATLSPQIGRDKGGGCCRYPGVYPRLANIRLEFRDPPAGSPLGTPLAHRGKSPPSASPFRVVSMGFGARVVLGIFSGPGGRLGQVRNGYVRGFTPPGIHTPAAPPPPSYTSPPTHTHLITPRHVRRAYAPPASASISGSRASNARAPHTAWPCSGDPSLPYRPAGPN